MGMIPAPDRSSIRRLRGPKSHLVPDRPQGYVLEHDPLGDGNVVPCATYFLTGSECRFACSFCDLWKYTLDVPTPIGSLVRQIEALHKMLESRGESFDWLKLYNASNFFDPQNVPIEDYARIAVACNKANRLVVENHAALTSSVQGQQLIRAFQKMLRPHLEIAMGLETIDPEAVGVMNKSMLQKDFEAACGFLQELGISVRAFVLLQPPGTRLDSARDWGVRTCVYAFERGVERCSIIPVRQGNGWVDRWVSEGRWVPPDLTQVEWTLRSALENVPSPGQIVSVDMWDWELLAGGCDRCRKVRYDTIQRMNFEQRIIPRDPCPVCETTRDS